MEQRKSNFRLKNRTIGTTTFRIKAKRIKFSKNE